MPSATGRTRCSRRRPSAKATPASSSRRCSPTARPPPRWPPPRGCPCRCPCGSSSHGSPRVDDLDAALQHYRLLVAAELETSDRESYGSADPAPARDAQGRGGARARRRGHRVRPRRARGAHAPAHARHDARQARLVVAPVASSRPGGRGFARRRMEQPHHPVRNLLTRLHGVLFRADGRALRARMPRRARAGARDARPQERQAAQRPAAVRRGRRRLGRDGVERRRSAVIPAWYLNLEAEPRATVDHGGRAPRRARADDRRARSATGCSARWRRCTRASRATAGARPGSCRSSVCGRRATLNLSAPARPSVGDQLVELGRTSARRLGRLTTMPSCVLRASTTTASSSGEGFSSRCGT